jgi:D-xylose reductase
MDLMSYATIQPAVLQVELHPLNSQKALVEFCQSRGVLVTAFSPLGSPSYVSLGMDDSLGQGLLVNPAVTAIAAKHHKTPAQILLRWNVQRSVHVIFKTTSVERMRENLDVEAWALNAADVVAIDALNQNRRFNDPGEFCKGMGGAIPIYA